MRRSRALKLVVVALVVAAVASRAGAAPPPKVSNVTATPVPTLAGHAARYTIGFTTSSTGDLVTGNTITVTFPSGTVPGLTCGNAAAFTGNVTVNGFAITAPVSIPSCLVVVVPVPAGAAAVIGNSSPVTLVLGSSSNVIKNPGAGNKTLKVRTTRDTPDVKSATYAIAPNATPVANGQAVAPSPEDTPNPITLTGSDANDDPLSFSISASPAHGTLGPIGAPNCAPLNTCSASVTYTPAANYFGPDSFKFRVNDTVVSSALSGGNVTITVTAVPDAPIAVDDSTTVAEGSGPSTVAVLANDSDADGDTLTITSNSAAANGTAACGSSSCTYTPNAGFSGSDSFTYTIDDGNGGTDTATVFVEVTPTAGPASFELCAKTDTATLVSSTTVPIWGFALGDCDVAGPATLPGPQLTVNPGDQVTITLDNSLSQNVSLELPGQNLAPDPTGTPPGEEKAYTFTAGGAGTYLYESGNNRQTLMGLYGALIVGGAGAYNAEGVLVLSEVDPAFNAAPTSFNLLDYAPKYWLINGKSYPDTAQIVAAAGDDVLLRYVNAGTVHHTMTLLGLHQRVIAKDGYPVTYPYDVVGETVPAGATMDTAVALPTTGTKSFPLYSRQLHLDNAGAPGGGMLTYLDPQPAAAARPAALTLTVGSVSASVGAHRVSISARTVACSPCRAQARLLVAGIWRTLPMTRSNGRWVATFRTVPSGRWAYQARVRDADSGTALASARQSVRVR
jgi:plastocyanin